MEDESRKLVARAGRGDAVAVDELLERHLPGLLEYVRKHIGPLLRSKESSSDVVQSVCREVLQDVGRIEYQGEAAFANWLHQAALRKLVDHHRYHTAEKRAAGRELPGESATTFSPEEFALLASSIRSPSTDASLREEVELLERGFEQLSPEDRGIVRMIYIEGLSHAQAAARLECTEPASRKMLSRALSRLSRHI